MPPLSVCLGQSYSVTSYTYSALDLLTNLTDAKGNITGMPV